mmetsp:Transcript_21144/g.30573  ORF Transcript_21144/g.30573 Transcript_21144/m.30573 type:complete len:204 (-) Transcript_21144:286-897(-)
MQSNLSSESRNRSATFNFTVLIATLRTCERHNDNLFEMWYICESSEAFSRMIAVWAVLRDADCLTSPQGLCSVSFPTSTRRNLILCCNIFLSTESSAPLDERLEIGILIFPVDAVLWLESERYVLFRCAMVVAYTHFRIGFWGKGVFNKGVTGRVIYDDFEREAHTTGHPAQFNYNLSNLGAHFWVFRHSLSLIETQISSRSG